MFGSLETRHCISATVSTSLPLCSRWHRFPAPPVSPLSLAVLPRQNTIVADSILGSILLLTPYIEPAANMVLRQNVFAGINTTSAPGGSLQYGVNGFTSATLADSGNLKPFTNYGFEKGSPPGWPALHLNDSVVREFDRNSYFQVQGHSLEKMQTLGWENHSVVGVDPQFVGRGSTAPWNRTCTDYMMKPTSPVLTGGFRPIDVTTTGLTSAFGWDRSELGRVDATTRVQTERYNRMHGLWRSGSLGISDAGSPAKGFVFAPDAWARFDNVYADCPAPCTLILRAKGGPVTVSLATGAPASTHSLVTATIPAKGAWSIVNATVPMGAGVSLHGDTVFLMLNASCSIDYFYLAH